MAEKTEDKTPAGATITELVTAIKEQTGKDVEQQNLRATLRNLVKKGDLVHEPRTRWAFSDEDIATVVEHYNKPEPSEDEKAEKPAKKAPAKKSKAKKQEEAEVEEAEDDDDLELEDI